MIDLTILPGRVPPPFENYLMNTINYTIQEGVEYFS